MSGLAATSLLDGLIASKLCPPVLDPRAISRSGFEARALEGQPAGRAITLVAPAGSGKSSLMTQLHRALGACGVAASWLGLDAEDNDPATFARYFISALHAIDPRFAREELTALGANPVRDFDPFFARLISRLSALERPVAIFLDDFQHVREPCLLRFVDGLLAHLPETLTVVIASRHQLPLQLARFALTGRVLEFGQEDLHFDQDQTDLFLRRYHQVELAPEDLRHLVDLTEGWPAGVQLAGLALRRHHGPVAELLQSFSGRDRDLTRYLVESVIRTQSDEVRRFLLRTSMLRRMCVGLCDAVSAADDAQRMLDEVGRANLFLIALDRQGQWYRYHHLFAEFLQNEYRRTDPSGYREACLQAAQWCEQHGEPAEATRYALDAENYEQAADLIARHALRTALFRGDHYTVRDWMRRLPTAFHARRPELLLAHAWSCAFSRDTARAMQITEDVLKRLRDGSWPLDDDEREHWLLWTGVVQAATCACADTIEECIARSDALLPRVPAAESFLTATLGNCLSYSHFAQRDFERSREFAITAHEHGHRADAAYLSAWGDFLHGLIDIELGALRAAGRFGQRVHRDSAGLGLGQKSYVAGLSALLQAEIAVQRGDFEGAAAQIEVGRAFKEIFGPVEPQLVALRNEARLLVHRREIDKAQAVLEEGQDAALREQHRRLYLSLAMEQVSLLLVAGRPDEALRAVRRSRLFDVQTVQSGWLRARRDALRLLDARLHLAQGDARTALRMLTALQQARGAEAQRSFTDALAVMAHRALALWSTGQTAEGLRQLDRALTAAAAEHHAFPILLAGKLLLPLLQAMSERRPEVEAETLRSRLNLQSTLATMLSEPTAQAAASSAGLVEAAVPVAAVPVALELTRRELELVGLLQAGLDNRRIADALLVSVPTVKWHLHNVYEKLGVGSRGSAVAVAVREGLLAPIETGLRRR